MPVKVVFFSEITSHIIWCISCQFKTTFRIDFTKTTLAQFLYKRLLSQALEHHEAASMGSFFLGSFIREGVGDLEEQQPDWHQTNSIRLPNPALVEMVLEGEVHEHSAKGVGVPKLGHGEIQILLSCRSESSNIKLVVSGYLSWAMAKYRYFSLVEVNQAILAWSCGGT